MCTDDILAGRLVSALLGWAPHLGVFHAVFPFGLGTVPTVLRLPDYPEVQFNSESPFYGLILRP